METPMIKPGIYLIIDPSMNEETLLGKLKIALKENISAIQIWNNFRNDQLDEKLVFKICRMAHFHHVPVLINNQWEYMLHLPLQGVHFDDIPENYTEIKRRINKPFLSGITCNNDLLHIHWASENNMDYISFCSMFPSQTSNSCELVNFKTVRDAENIFNGLIFLAGGINLENIRLLDELTYDGVAIVSGIMSSETPAEAIRNYNRKIKK